MLRASEIIHIITIVANAFLGVLEQFRKNTARFAVPTGIKLHGGAQSKCSNAKCQQLF